jgi:hypothetical protein
MEQIDMQIEATAACIVRLNDRHTFETDMRRVAQGNSATQTIISGAAVVHKVHCLLTGVDCQLPLKPFVSSARIA